MRNKTYGIGFIKVLVLNPKVHSPLHAALLLLLRPIHFIAGRPGLPASGFIDANTFETFQRFLFLDWVRLAFVRLFILDEMHCIHFVNVLF